MEIFNVELRHQLNDLDSLDLQKIVSGLPIRQVKYIHELI